MACLFRLLLATLLAFAVPLQGLAGVTMAACGPTHDAQAVHGSGGHAAGANAHDHAAMAHDHAAMGHEPGALPPVTSTGGDHTSHGCTACAACCSLSAAPVPAATFHGASPAPNLAIPFLEVSRASFQPAALERPPSPSYLG